MAFAAVGLNAGQGQAQEDLNRGKSAQQLYASDCVECHKNPRALGNRDNPGSLSNFLRVHYTASRESASALAAYLVSLGPEPRGARPAGAGTASRPRPASTPEPGKSEPGKPGAVAEPAKPVEAAKPAESEPAKEQEKAAPAAAAPPASEPAPAAPAAAPAAPAAPPADPQ